MSLKAVFLTLLMAALPALLTGCGFSKADGNAVETLGQLKALSAAIGTVSDIDSAARASPSIEMIGRRLTQLAAERSSLGEVSGRNEHIVQDDIPNARQEVAQRAAILQMSSPQAARIVGEALTRGTDPSRINEPAMTYSNLPATVQDLPLINQPLPAPLQNAVQNALRRAGVH